MKSLKILAISFFGAALGLAASSCTESTTTETDYINLSVTSFTFASEGETLNLEVQASSISGEDWNYQGGAEWLTAERSGDTLKLTAASNKGGELRETSLSFLCGEAETVLSLTQLAGNFPGGFVNLSTEQNKFSINSKFCASYRLENPADGGAQIFIPIVINTETGEETVYEGSSEYSNIRAVSDDGRMLSLTVGSIGCALLIDGERVDIPTPSGYQNPVISAFSEDGSIMVGYVSEISGYAYHPVSWVNMTPMVLDIPETDMNGEDLFSGAMARGCSADGSIIYGSEWDTQGFIYWDENGMHFAGKESSITRPISYMGMTIDMPAYFMKTAESYSISQNGRYVAGTFNDWMPNGDGTYMASSMSYPAVYDIQEDSLIVFEEYSGHTAHFADNEGRVFGGVAGKGYVYTESGATPVEEWLASEYGLVVDGDRYIMNISEDGRRLSGWRSVMNASSQTLFLGWYYVEQ